jgi:hypothetical protein
VGARPTWETQRPTGVTCDFFKQAMLQHSAKDLSVTIKQAKKYHLALDRGAYVHGQQKWFDFSIMPKLIDLDPDYAPFNQGSYGFHYMRTLPAKGFMPSIEAIFTRVSFQVLEGLNKLIFVKGDMLLTMWQSLSKGRLSENPYPVPANGNR